MERTKIICHMFVSLDGKIDTAFPDHPDLDAAGELYERMGYEYGQAIGIGRNTVDTGIRPDLSAYKDRKEDHQDHVIVDDCTYSVVFDRFGKLSWSGPYQEYDNMPKRRIIEVLSESVQPGYQAYLDDLQIPYIFAGRDDIDLKTALIKLKAEFGIDTMVLGGGSTLNGVFFRDDLVDKISLVVVPCVDGRQSGLSLFGGDSGVDAKLYTLTDVQTPGFNTVLLHYERTRR